MTMYKITNIKNKKAIVRNNKETIAFINFLKKYHYDISILKLVKLC